MNKIISMVLLVVLFQGCKITGHQKNNSIDVKKKVILEKEGQTEFFYWELKDQRALWAFELGAQKGLNKYRDSLKLELGSENYQLAIHKESLQNLEKSLIEKEKNGDRINALLVHTGRIGKIRKINYLESQILNYQIERFPMFSKPTEFHAFIVKNESKGVIRIYFAASNTEWPPHPTIILKELEKEVKKGWKLIYHLHNHYCKIDKDYIGILAPSLADAQYYKMLKERFNLEKALITNGFHTVEIKSKDFDEFESH